MAGSKSRNHHYNHNRGVVEIVISRRIVLHTTVCADKPVPTESQPFDILHRIIREDKSLSSSTLGKALPSTMQHAFLCPSGSKLPAPMWNLIFINNERARRP